MMILSARSRSEDAEGGQDACKRTVQLCEKVQARFISGPQEKSS